MNITIREYREDDRASLEYFLGLLQDFVASIDPLHRIKNINDFDVKTYAARSLEEVRKHAGAIYFAEDGKKIVGCITDRITTMIKPLKPQ